MRVCVQTRVADRLVWERNILSRAKKLDGVISAVSSRAMEKSSPVVHETELVTGGVVSGISVNRMDVNAHSSRDKSKIPPANMSMNSCSHPLLPSR